LHESVVQAFPSSHSPEVSVCWQPEPGRHESAVQAFPSSQFVDPPPEQLPPLQASPEVQALPSSHGLLLLVCVHPVPESHASVVHGLPSSQLTAGPPWHEPPLHASLEVQASPSLHDAELLVCPQAPAPSHSSVVQALSSVVHAVPVEVWFGWQAPDPSQASGSSHSVSELSPHAEPADTNPPSTHEPEPQLSGLTHSEPASPHEVPSTA